MSPDVADGVAEGGTASPVLQAVVDTLVEATGAQAGWIVGGEGNRLVVRAASGDGTTGLVGRSVPAATGSAGFVMASGQPVALAGDTSDPRLAEGITQLTGLIPGSLVCVPCDTPDGVIGALEAVEKRGAARFTFDDIELASLLSRHRRGGNVGGRELPPGVEPTRARARAATAR